MADLFNVVGHFTGIFIRRATNKKARRSGRQVNPTWLLLKSRIVKLPPCAGTQVGMEQPNS